MRVGQVVAAVCAISAALSQPAFSAVHICSASPISDVATIQQEAAAGHATAMCKLASAYLHGEVVQGGPNQAKSLYEEAARLGKGCGYNGLGNLYFTGVLGERDYSAALDDYKKAYSLGYPVAANNIAKVYSNQTPPDYADANHWYSVSISLGCAEGYNDLGEAFEFGYGKTVDGRRAETYLLAAANAGMPEAKVDLGTLFLDGSKTQNYAKALRWFSEVPNWDLARYQMGRMYYYGYGVMQNRNQAYTLFLEAARQGLGIAEVAVGRMLDGGDGTARNETQSVEWLQVAAQQGETSALFLLGMAYSGGRGIPVDTNKALSYFRAAVAHGDAISASILALSYRYGTNGVTADPVKAYAYAAAAGETDRSDAEQAAHLKKSLSKTQLSVAQSILDGLPPMKQTPVPPEP